MVAEKTIPSKAQGARNMGGNGERAFWFEFFNGGWWEEKKEKCSGWTDE